MDLLSRRLRRCESSEEKGERKMMVLKSGGTRGTAHPTTAVAIDLLVGNNVSKAGR